MRQRQPLCQNSSIIISGKAEWSEGTAATWSTQFFSTADESAVVPVWRNISSLMGSMWGIWPVRDASHGGTAG